MNYEPRCPDGLTRARFLTGASTLAFLSVLSGCSTNATLQRDVDGFPGIAGIVLRRSSGVIFEKRPRDVFPAASLAKLAVLLATLRYHKTFHSLSMSHIIVSDAAFSATSPYLSVRPGQSAAVTDLLRLMIVESDNLAANILISRLSVDFVDDTSKRYGLKKTAIYGLYSDRVDAPSRATTTPEDMAYLLLLFYRAAESQLPGIDPLSARFAIDLMCRSDRSMIAPDFPSDIALATKTGAVSEVRNLVAIANPYGSDPLFMVVLIKDLRPPHFGDTSAYTAYDQAVDGIRRFTRDAVTHYGERA